jgi:hypothetical protein
MDAMDYQSFAGQPQHPSFAGSFSSTPVASTGQTHSPQQHPHLYAADPHARLQQQQQPSPSFPYAAQANGPQQPMMQAQLHRAAALQQHHQQLPQHQLPQHQLPQQSPYSPAPSFALSSTPTHQQFAHNRQTASPAASTPGNPYAPPHAHSLSQHSQHSQQSPSPLGSSAAAASTAQLSAAMTAVKPDPALHTPLKTVPPSPISPVAQARNQERMATLLDINNLLISEACELQTQGKGGQIGPPEGDKAQPSKEYIDYVRRLQANLSYLAQNAEKNPKPGQPIQPGPAIMHAPAAHDELAKLYLKLQGLFPGWKGAQPGAAKQSPGPQRLNSTSSVSQLQLQSQPPGSAGLQSNWGQNAMQNMQQAQAKAEPQP